jgi:hypothetical protein
MIQGMVEYKGELIAPKSDAMVLFEAKKWKELDAHLVQLNKEYMKWRNTTQESVAEKPQQ